MKPSDLGKSVRVLFTGSSFIFFWSGGVVLSWLVFPLIGLHRLPEREKRRRYQGWVKWGFRVFHDYMRFFGLTDYDPRKVEIELPEGPFVMISNHPTLVDITALMSVVGDLSVVVKGSFWRSKVRRLLGACGHIHGGHDEGALSSASVAVQALERLRDGQSVMIFPEGTRSPEHGLHPFQRGAFEIARRAGVPLVPVFITAEPAWLMKHQRWYQVPPRMNSMRVKVLEGVSIGVPQGSSKEQAHHYQDLYQARLERWLHKMQRSGMVRD